MPSIPRHALAACALAVSVLIAGCGGGEEAGLTRVKTALTTRDSKLALVELKSFLQKHPKSAEGRYLLAKQLLVSGNNAAALAEMQRALEAGHPSHVVIPQMARTMLKAGEAGKVLSMFKDEKLADTEAMASLSASVALAMALQGDMTGAQARVDQALETAPGSVSARLTKARLDAVSGRSAEALKSIDALLVEQPGNAEVWATKGDFLLRMPGGAAGAAGAAEAFAKALEINPIDLYALSSTVAVQLSLGNVKAARQAQVKLSEVAPNMLATGSSEAAVAYVTGDHTRAREIYQALIKAVPTDVQLLMLAGENEMRLSAFTQAEAMFAKASALAPSNAIARRLLAQAQLKLGQAQRALVTLAPIVDTPTAGAEVLAIAAEARALNGETRAAQALYDRLAKLTPADARLRTLVATAGFGRADDIVVFQELRSIANEDKGNTADLALINAHLSRGQPDAALAALASLQRKQPNDPMPSHMRGQVLANLGKLADARQSLEAALALQPGYFPSLAALALLDMKEGKADVARQRFEKVIKAQPQNATAMLMLAEVLERQKAPAKVVRVQLDAAIKAAPGDVAARVALTNHLLAGGDMQAAFDAAQSSTAALPDNIELLGVLADLQMRSGQDSQALATYGKIASLQPKSPQGQLGMAEVYLKVKQFDMAQRSVTKALELSPGLASARRLAVRIALANGQPAAAVNMTRQMQADHPGDASGFLLEAEVQMRQRQWAAAAAVLRKVLDKSPTGPASALLYRALARGDRPADAVQFAAQRLAARPQDTGLLLELADTARQRNELDAAQKYYERLLALQPDHLPALNNLAMLHLTRKQPGALALARRAASLAPLQSAILDTLAQAQEAEGSVVDAIATLREAVSHAPEQPEYRLALARLLLRNGDRADALPHLKRLAALGTGFSAHAEVAELVKRLGPMVR